MLQTSWLPLGLTLSLALVFLLPASVTCGTLGIFPSLSMEFGGMMDPGRKSASSSSSGRAEELILPEVDTFGQQDAQYYGGAADNSARTKRRRMLQVR